MRKFLAVFLMVVSILLPSFFLARISDAGAEEFETSAETESSVIKVAPPCDFTYPLDVVNANRFHHNDDGVSVDLPMDGSVLSCKNDSVLASFTGRIEKAGHYCEGKWNTQFFLHQQENGHDTGIKVQYVHHYENYTPAFKSGFVTPGQKLTTIGDRGCADGRHIHFAVNKNGQWLPYSRWKFSDDVGNPGGPTLTSLKVRQLDHGHWTSWNQIGQTLVAPVMARFNGKLYIAKRGKDNSLKVRNKKGSNAWSSWNEIGQAKSTPAMIVYNNKLFLAKQGANNTLKINKHNGTRWTGWVKIGMTQTTPALAVFNGKLFVAKRGLDNSFKVRTFNGSKWSSWKEMGKTKAAPEMQVFDGKLFIAKRSTENVLKIRKNSGSGWSSWQKIGMTKAKPEMVVYRRRLYVAKKGLDDSLAIRNFYNGSWTKWNKIGKTQSPPEMIVYNDKLFVAKRGFDNSLKIKKKNGQIWGGWAQIGKTKGKPAMAVYDGKLYFAKKGVE